MWDVAATMARFYRSSVSVTKKDAMITSLSEMKTSLAINHPVKAITPLESDEG